MNEQQAYLVNLVLNMHPLLQGLVTTLPTAGVHWDRTQQQKWLSVAQHVFTLVYQDDSASGQGEG